MTEIALKGNRGDLLTPSEHFRYTNAIWVTFVYYENNFLQHRAGALSDEQFEATLESLKWQCLLSGIRACWIQSRGLFEKHFALFMDELVAKYPAVRDPTRNANEVWTREVGKQVASVARSLGQVQL